MDILLLTLFFVDRERPVRLHTPSTPTSTYMPIKLPKVLARRKSSGNLLDAVETPPTQPSFRVLSRGEVESNHAQDRAFEVTRKSGRWTTGPPVLGNDEGQASGDW